MRTIVHYPGLLGSITQYPDLLRSITLYPDYWGISHSIPAYKGFAVLRSIRVDWGVLRCIHTIWEHLTVSGPTEEYCVVFQLFGSISQYPGLQRSIAPYSNYLGVSPYPGYGGLLRCIPTIWEYLTVSGHTEEYCAVFRLFGSISLYAGLRRSICTPPYFAEMCCIPSIWKYHTVPRTTIIICIIA